MSPRMRLRRRTIILLAFALIVIAYGVHVARWRALPLVGDLPHDGYVRVTGVVHVHTTLSDGAATPDQGIAAAHEAGLQFVGITDHNNLHAKRWGGGHDGLLGI